jgi:hypothetical protein
MRALTLLSLLFQTSLYQTWKLRRRKCIARQMKLIQRWIISAIRVAQFTWVVLWRVSHFPHHYDYEDLRHTPAELKTIFKNSGLGKVVAFQPHNPLHRAHLEMAMQATQDENSKLLFHPLVGMTKPGDVDHYTRIRCYQHV